MSQQFKTKEPSKIGLLKGGFVELLFGVRIVFAHAGAYANVYSCAAFGENPDVAAW